MVTEVWMEWSTLAQTDAIFPWHDDYVAEVWVKFRKFTKAQKEIVFNAFCIPMPCRFDQPGE
jgi:hypothetical protein